MSFDILGTSCDICEISIALGCFSNRLADILTDLRRISKDLICIREEIEGISPPGLCKWFECPSSCKKTAVKVSDWLCIAGN
jgi:hypothetical protein